MPSLRAKVLRFAGIEFVERVHCRNVCAAAAPVAQRWVRLELC
jgi:hypothetical protein